jgi:hypothetical protein
METAKQESRLKQWGKAFFTGSGWNTVSAIAAMLTVFFAWMAIKLTSEMWREERRSRRPYFALGERTISPIVNDTKPFGYRLQYDVKNVGNSPARNVHGARMSVDAALPTDTWSALIYLFQHEKKIQMNDLLHLPGVTTDSISLHVFALYGDVESGGAVGSEVIYHSGLNVSRKYIAIKLKYIDAVSGEIIEQPPLVWRWDGVREGKPELSFYYPERSEAPIRYIDKALSTSVPSP